MSKGKISKSIAAADMQQALQLLSQLDTLLKPYYSQIDDKSELPMVSDDRLAFVAKGLQYAGTDPGYLPQDSEVQELKNDYNLFNDSRKIFVPLKQISAGMFNTNNLAGSDAFVTLLEYYAIVGRRANQGDARAKVIYDDLRKLFVRKKRSAVEDGSPALTTP